MKITASDHETAVTARGTRGPAVVLVHSLGLDHRMWDPVLDRLAEGRRVFAYDVRGHGSAAGAPLPFTMAATAADLLAVLDALEVDTAHVAGLSLGGAIAQTAAVAAPGRFASLAVLAAPDRPAPEAFEERARLAETAGMTPLIEPTLERWFTPAPWPPTPAACGTPVRAWRRSIRRRGRRSGAGTAVWMSTDGFAASPHRRWRSPARRTRRSRSTEWPPSPAGSAAGARNSRSSPMLRTSRRWNVPTRWPTPWPGSCPRRSTSRNLGACPTWNR
ncbi:alpha/beta fold hydrolase [Amycolatopsis sp. NPDC058278]|uniref:alpha/beta fold hydrolase n=1 Tax=Amycolatopsis sp. NPDC058278 TaxID=3346417 RepID=UPI0036DD4C2B